MNRLLLAIGVVTLAPILLLMASPTVEREILTFVGDVMPIVNAGLLLWLFIWARNRKSPNENVHGTLLECPSQAELDERIDKLAKHVDELVEERNTHIEALHQRVSTTEMAISEKILNCQKCLEIAVAQGNDAATSQAKILAAAEARRVKDEIARLRGLVIATDERVSVLGKTMDDVAKAIVSIKDEETNGKGENKS